MLRPCHPLFLARPPCPTSQTFSCSSIIILRSYSGPKGLLIKKKKQKKKHLRTFRASNECFPGPRPWTTEGSQACTCPGTGEKKRRVPGEERPFPVLVCPQATGESLSVVLERAASPCSKLSSTQRETGYTIWWTKEDCLVL